MALIQSFSQFLTPYDGDGMVGYLKNSKNLYSYLVPPHKEKLLDKASQLFVMAVGMDSYVNIPDMTKNDIPLLQSCGR